MIATSSANRKAASNSQAVERMIQGGGSCGSISDSTSSEPRSVSCELIDELAQIPSCWLEGKKRRRGCAINHSACQTRQSLPVRGPTMNELPETVLSQ